MQVARVVLVHVIRVGVLGVTVVHIGHDEVLVVVLKSISIFVVIFCIWRCTLYKFGKKVLPGFFLGYALSVRGGIWKSDVPVADFEELETMDASEIYSKKDSMRMKCYFLST